MICRCDTRSPALIATAGSLAVELNKEAGIGWLVWFLGGRGGAQGKDVETRVELKGK